MSTRPLRPLGIGELLDIAINIFTKNAVTLFKVASAVVVPLQLLSVIVLLLTVSDPALIRPNAFGGGGGTRQLNSSDGSALLAGFAAVTVIGALLFVLATAACFKAVSDAYLGERPEWRRSLSFARKHLLSIVWLAILTFACLLLALIPLGIPAVWLYVSWAVATPALLFEDCRGRKALGRSFRLVRRRWWPTFAALLVAFILAGIVNAILSALFSALASTGAGDSVLGAAVLNGLSGTVAQVLTTPFTAAVAVVIYYDLRVRKEGFDLHLMMDRLSSAPQDAAPPAPGGWLAPEAADPGRPPGE
ncbi:MAG: glycerophosphoryl diester phosphodiesterase membrane domain-containing protein [Thermoleophilaceae bacterium]